MTNKRGRPSIIGERILKMAQFYRTVGELADKTGATRDCVRKVLRTASDRGQIVLGRFVQGKSGNAMVIKRGR